MLEREEFTNPRHLRSGEAFLELVGHCCLQLLEERLGFADGVSGREEAEEVLRQDVDVRRDVELVLDGLADHGHVRLHHDG